MSTSGGIPGGASTRGERGRRGIARTGQHSSRTTFVPKIDSTFIYIYSAPTLTIFLVPRVRPQPGRFVPGRRAISPGDHPPGEVSAPGDDQPGPTRGERGPGKSRPPTVELNSG